jgi:hypothetical protein
MSEEGRFGIPKEMRSMAEASLDQARKAFEKFVSSAQAAAGSPGQRGRRSAPASGMDAAKPKS